MIPIVTRNVGQVGLRRAWLPEEFLSATNSGFVRVKSERDCAIAKTTLRVGRAECAD